jgi:2-polyprenyl-3-methyl-5-hydroxy-6-metoxy-1,4-benzoquinol methylase
MLNVRSLAEEQMDAAELDPATYTRVLGDLARVNTVTLARRPTLRFLKQVQREEAGRRMAERRAEVGELMPMRVGPVPLKILDVGFGDGDMLRTIARWAGRNFITPELVGIDLNPGSAPAARAATPAELGIDYRTGDYRDLAGEGWDVIISSLVAHHMGPVQLVEFLGFMDREVRCGWFVNDLHRHGFAYAGYPLLARIMGWHRIVREDGQLSIARSFRPPEWPPILAEAGVTGAEVVRRFPFRLCVQKIR